ncbi:DUF3137 domain-containing protein [Pedobacter hiemivivus]|uniref:DUF3137 domain-containing protein n=1 Tax=Pedobacter hiemivivus TaxID=2530454 RepID=A0A4U1FZM4_9SPHI|nr:DUF3137 domain-containing protein [Pedobacter hiemivivus]TKC56029.1 DUF3137 domain-containing protein [Pedobacter hiemivivus]
MDSVLADLENQRKEVSALKIKSYLCIAIGILTIVAGIASGTFAIAGAVIGGIMLITGFVLWSKTNAKFYQYRHSFKQGVIPLVLKTIDESLEMDYTNGLSEKEFICSQLFSKEPDRYRSEDQVSGIAGKTSFSFSELHAEYKTVTQTKNGRQEHWHTILKGIVFYADFNKNFNGVTIVRPKDMGTALGAWISKAMPIFNSSDRTPVRLENPEFEKEFATYSTDQVEARYILTPAMMERLCELNKRCSYTISLSFIGSCVFIAFPLNKDYFEPPVYKSILTSGFLNEDTEVIRFMYGIIKDLDLNTRIWTKN